MAQATPARTKAFISYSEKDKAYLEELQEHLKGLEHFSMDQVFWADTEIKPGDLRHVEIEAALAAAKVAILLVSPSFFASDFLHMHNLLPLLEAAKARQTVIFSVILLPSIFEHSPLAAYQPVNPPSRPLEALSRVDRHNLWLEVVRRVAQALQLPLPWPNPLPEPPHQPAPPLPSKAAEQLHVEGISSPEVALKDFLISYSEADRTWAEWMALTLEAEGYTTSIQAWDVRPGMNLVREMDQAVQRTRRTIVVLSPNYVAAERVHPEWHAAFRRDPTGAQALLVPVQCATLGLPLVGYWRTSH